MPHPRPKWARHLESAFVSLTEVSIRGYHLGQSIALAEHARALIDTALMEMRQAVSDEPLEEQLKESLSWAQQRKS